VAERDYSGTPLLTKLGVRVGSRLKVLGAPPGFPLTGRARAPVDVVILFTARRSELARRFPKLADDLASTGGLWVAYPKQASGAPTDLSFAVVQEIGLDAGLVDNKSCAIDETWTAVRFVRRLEDR
jgi:hypothetical protein